MSFTVGPETQLMFTCEHGGYRIPAQFERFFPNQVLKKRDHRHWDPGALELTKFLSHQLKAPYFANDYSRLLIDCNRSDYNKSRFSPWTRSLSENQKKKIQTNIALAYKTPVRKFVRKQLEMKRSVFAVSIHSFTPIYKGERRKTELGILFRLDRPFENSLGESLVSLSQQWTTLSVHKNKPYQGKTDCFVNELSLELRNANFQCLMIEANFGLLKNSKKWQELKWGLAASLNSLLGRVKV